MEHQKSTKDILIVLLIYLASVAAKLILALDVPTPAVYLDEYIYSAMAQTFVQLKPFVFLRRWSWYPPLYSLALTPAFAFDSMEVSYMIMKTINSFVLSSLIFPVWVLSRQFFSRWCSTIVALLTALMPLSNTYPAYLLAENLFIPIFLLSLLLILKTSLHGGARWEIACGVSIGLCYLTKLTGLVLIIVAILALVFKPMLKDLKLESTQPLLSIKAMRSLLGSSVRQIARSWPIWICFLATVAPWSIYNVFSFGYSLQAVTGLGTQPSPKFIAKFSNLGNISVTILANWFFMHINYIVLAIAVVPLIICTFCATYYILRGIPKSELPCFIFVVEALSAFLLLSFIAAGQAYPDHRYLLGRYVDPVLPALVVAGFVGLRRYIQLNTREIAGAFILFLASCILILSFSPLKLMAPVNTTGISYLLGATKLHITGLLMLSLGLMILLRVKGLKWNHSFLVFTIFLSAFFISTTPPAYLQVMWDSRYSEHELYISKWLKQNNIQGAAICFDESSEGLTPLRKNRIVWGLWFWMGYQNVKVKVGPIEELNGVDYLISSRELNLEVVYSYCTKGVTYYIYDVKKGFASASTFTTSE